MSDLSTHLNTVLDIMPWSKSADQVRETIDSISAAKRHLHILESRLHNSCKQMIGDLALNLKKDMPELNLAVVESECKIGNRTRVTKIHVDISECKWVITTESGSQKFDPITIDITSDLTTVVKVISDQFSDKGGDGKILVEGKISTTTRLADWARPRLNSRLSRMSR